MESDQVLHQAEIAFLSRYIEDARLEAELLLMHVLGVGRAELYVQIRQTLSPQDVERFWGLVQRRLTHEPTAYILGRREFFSDEFYIDSRSLIPRPESELLVEQALEFAARRFPLAGPCTIADVGTGSGVLAISLALHLPQAIIYAIDISSEALQVARINCRKHNVQNRVHLIRGDLLEPFSCPLDIIVANLPYVRDTEMDHLMPEVRMYEPEIALRGGIDGLDKIRRLVSQAGERLLTGGLMLLEVGQGQGTAVCDLARSCFPDAVVDTARDLGGIERVVRVMS